MRRFCVEGEPVAKARARVLINGHHYTPKKTGMAETLIAWTFRSAFPGVGVDAASRFEVNVRFVLTPYQNGHPRKFDLDNGLKLVLDALNGVVWADDNQVVSVLAYKSDGKEPQTMIEIDRLPAPLEGE